MKAYTDIEQSKKLAEILPLESADMYYWCGEDLRIGGHKAMNTEYDIPCWSLAALLGVLPRFIELDTHCTFLLIYQTQNLGWVVEYSNDKDDIVDFSFANKHLIDACYEMILKFHEQNLL